MNHIVLLGDSIFDNSVYINGGLDTIAHLRQQIPSEWTATLKAIDGSVTSDVLEQIQNLPSDVSHLIVSVGGNDALRNAGILQQSADSTAEVLNNLADLATTFEYDYQQMLQGVLRLRKPTAVCTIYYPSMVDPFVQKIAVTALTVFNDVIIRQAFLAGLPLIDLRLVCNEPRDYANEIEPSEVGGLKIAKAIAKLVKEHNFQTGRTEVFF